ncbi:mandelate racemase/muconate lactonizing enzyme family protein [Hansschlegelia sp. KR7-227]|uniref:mandelate racemase/muconate lactonizing enzyme family protein n=1 Tax=Hansschlegelia sp. KR7-227 TaxID=3400914 RepID=UPI003C09B5AB
MRDARIEDLRLHLLRLPLREPYKLAFGPVDAFCTILVTLRIDGALGVGDATVLTGYTEETIEGAWRLAGAIAEDLEGRTVDELWRRTKASLAEAPFTVTAFRSAAEMALAHPVLRSDVERRVPLLKILHGEDEPTLEREIEASLAAGYRTFKIKVGFDLEPDLARVALIQRLAAGRARLTVDANQGYDVDAGRAFAARVDPRDLAFFEQACSKDDWPAACAVADAAKPSHLPLMLDEQIYDLSDVERTATLGVAQFVKLKLMKFGSLDALLAGITRTRELDLEPVLGNGVATDIGCWMEACVAHSRIDTAGEMNGFLKPMRPVTRNPLRMERGAVVIPANYWPELDMDAIAEHSVTEPAFA